jgi:uncharacterized protein (TIGR00730 family)
VRAPASVCDGSASRFENAPDSQEYSPARASSALRYAHAMSFSLCVFCGAAFGDKPQFASATRLVGQEIARRGWTLVYGGGRIGLMGVLADAALDAGGRVVGVMPGFLYEREVAHTRLTTLKVVASFAERKTRMGELADAFLSLPGGIGTMDELFEAWSWTHARLQDKPSGLLNVAGYYDALEIFIEGAVTAGFITSESRASLHVESEIAPLLDRLATPIERT